MALQMYLATLITWNTNTGMAFVFGFVLSWICPAPKQILRLKMFLYFYL